LWVGGRRQARRPTAGPRLGGSLSRTAITSSSRSGPSCRSEDTAPVRQHHRPDGYPGLRGTVR